MTDRHPRVSVVVATHNRAGRLADLLASLREQTLPSHEFEVIVVDDASADDTQRVLAAAAERGGLTLRTIRREQSGGPGAARNDGWRAATAPVVAFTDDDCVVASDWLERGLAKAGEHPGAVVQGRTNPIPAEADRLGPFSRTLRVNELGPYYQTCNIFYPRDVLERVGGFDAEAFKLRGEDCDLAWRAIAAGADTVFAPDAEAFHAVNRIGPVGRLRIAWLWFEAVQLFRRHPELRKVHLHYRVFWSGSHYLLLRAVVALLLRRRLPAVFTWWLGKPYLGYLVERGQREGGGPLLAPYWLAYDLVETAAMVRGSVRYRTFVL